MSIMSKLFCCDDIGIDLGATTMGNMTYYYNANGLSAGRTTTVGNTTYFYNANGSSAGTATKIGK